MLIAFAGKAGSGKDTAAAVLVDRCNFVKVALADEMKRICRDIFNFSTESLWGSSEKRNAVDSRYQRADGVGLTPRYALQKLGSEYGRHCYPDIWIDYLLGVYEQIQTGDFHYNPEVGLTHKLSSWIAPPTNVVVTDVRFLNELTKLKAAGGKVVLLERKSTLTGEAATHDSETSLDDIPRELFDYCIKNEGSVSELQDSTAALIQTPIFATALGRIANERFSLTAIDAKLLR